MMQGFDLNNLTARKKIGLYFGSFNPIHVGHLIIANFMAELDSLDEVWFVVTPQNPLKQKKNLLEDFHRLALVRVAIENNPKLLASDIEFNLPKPSYTVYTLQALKEKYPDYFFTLIMGEDNLRTLHKWKNYEYLIDNYPIIVYPRVLTNEEIKSLEQVEENDLINHANITLTDAPVMKISSSFIRQMIREGKDVRYLLTEAAFKYLDEMNFYR